MLVTVGPGLDDSVTPRCGGTDPCQSARIQEWKMVCCFACFTCLEAFSMFQASLLMFSTVSDEFDLEHCSAILSYLIYFSQPFWMLKTDPFTFFALRLEELKPS
jgi:hypothetical protein